MRIIFASRLTCLTLRIIFASNVKVDEIILKFIRQLIGTRSIRYHRSSEGHDIYALGGAGLHADVRRVHEVSHTHFGKLPGCSRLAQINGKVIDVS